MQRSELVCERGIICHLKVYTKRVPFLAQLVDKRVRDWTTARSLPYKVLLSIPPGVRKFKNK